MLSVFWETRVSGRRLAMVKFARSLHVDYGVHRENSIRFFALFIFSVKLLSLSLWHVLSGADLKYPFMVYSAVRTLYYR